MIDRDAIRQAQFRRPEQAHRLAVIIGLQRGQLQRALRQVRGRGAGDMRRALRGAEVGGELQRQRFLRAIRLDLRAAGDAVRRGDAGQSDLHRRHRMHRRVGDRRIERRALGAFAQRRELPSFGMELGLRLAIGINGVERRIDAAGELRADQRREIGEARRAKLHPPEREDAPGGNVRSPCALRLFHGARLSAICVPPSSPRWILAATVIGAPASGRGHRCGRWDATVNRSHRLSRRPDRRARRAPRSGHGSA